MLFGNFAVDNTYVIVVVILKYKGTALLMYVMVHHPIILKTPKTVCFCLLVEHFHLMDYHHQQLMAQVEETTIVYVHILTILLDTLNYIGTAINLVDPVNQIFGNDLLLVLLC